MGVREEFEDGGSYYGTSQAAEPGAPLELPYPLSSWGGRPLAAVIVSRCLAAIGGAILLTSLPVFWSGLIAGPHRLLLAGYIAAAGFFYLVLAWGFWDRRLWAWFGATLLTLPLAELVWKISDSGSPVLVALSWTLGGLLLVIQMFAWRASVRGWFWSG